LKPSCRNGTIRYKYIATSLQNCNRVCKIWSSHSIVSEDWGLTGMWCCVTGWALLSFSKECSTSIFKGQEVPFVWESTVICAIAGRWEAHSLAMWPHLSWSEPVTKGQNNSIKMCHQKRSKSWTSSFTNSDTLYYFKCKLWSWCHTI
jgi:hypothetical protein